MTAGQTSVVVAAVLAVWATAAPAHSGVPQKWWLDEATALRKVRTHEQARWDPGAYRGFSGRCRGLAPQAILAGRSVYKHFACTVRVRVNTVNFTFLYRVHVVGPRGRVSFGG